MIARTGLVLTILALPLGAQPPAGPCLDPLPRYGDGLVFFDRMSALYDRLDSAFRTKLGAGANLPAAIRPRFDALSAQIHDTFDRVAASAASDVSADVLFADLGNYQDFVHLGFGGAASTPGDIQERLCPMIESYLKLAQTRVADHSRKLSIRHGERSERLNIIEMVLNEWMSRKSGMGALRDPPRWEWIVRAQVVGYQYETEGGHFRPSSPTYQLGTSYYLFGTGAVSRALNHIGLALAYQRDLTNKQDLYGAVLHVQQYDFGVLCPRLNCSSMVLVGSKNLSVLSGAWTKLRRGLFTS